MRGLKLFNFTTETGMKKVVKFENSGYKFIVKNRSGGRIYVNMSDDVDESTGFPVDDGETYIMVENENIAQFDRACTDTIAILGTVTSSGENTVTVQMINYRRN